jgi:hypothetical protein
MTNAQMSRLVVLGSAGFVAMLLMGGLAFVMTRKGPPLELETVPPPPPPSSDSEEKNPGEKILRGADRAYETKYFETALKFYKDFDLRYAGTETYLAHVPQVWEKMRACDLSMPQRDASLPAYLEERQKLDVEWRRLKGRTGQDAQEELRKFLDRLPSGDGRRPLIEAQLGSGGDKK